MSEDQVLAYRLREQQQKEELPHGTYGVISREDLESTKHRMMTGVPLVHKPYFNEKQKIA